MMKQYLRSGRAVLALFGIIAILFLFALSSLPVTAHNITSVGVFDPAHVAVGAQVAVNVEIENVSDLYGYELILHFDPTLLSVDDADPFNAGVQVQLGSFISPDLLLFNIVDLSLGTVNVVLSQVNPSEPVSGSGVLFTVLFRGLANGESPLTFTGLILTDRDGYEISTEVVSSQVSVGTGATYQVYLPLIFNSGSAVVPSSAEPVAWGITK